MFDKVYWEWLCSLHKPSSPSTTIDPLAKSCNCGYHFHISKFQEVRMLLFGDIVITCPKCGAKMSFQLVYHCVKIKTEENKTQQEVWSNA